jgi:hypothetical protein
MQKITYTTTGRVTYDCGHQHRTPRAAGECIRKHHAACRRNGGYSDRQVVRSDGELVTYEEDREVSRGLGFID